MSAGKLVRISIRMLWGQSNFIQELHNLCSFLLLFNASGRPVEFVLPAPITGDLWEVVVDTREETIAVPTGGYRRGHAYSMAGRSLVLLGEPS